MLAHICYSFRSATSYHNRSFSHSSTAPYAYDLHVSGLLSNNSLRLTATRDFTSSRLTHFVHTPYLTNHDTQQFYDSTSFKTLPQYTFTSLRFAHFQTHLTTFNTDYRHNINTTLITNDSLSRTRHYPLLSLFIPHLLTPFTFNTKTYITSITSTLTV